ncbi:MAG: RIP metalloprotease RseP [Rhodospirillaceae bacterium]|nr:RIP metalloprotease RseP [Rhodospirillaceae bacterium]MCA8931238.1 RIP metalloprotease RseP [Rhodospirillaceae bacterium]
MLDYILPFIVVLSVLVFVHELGHYLAARMCRVRVEVFSIGFGPELFGFNDRAGTRWKISAMPLGGYVKMLGDMDASSRPDKDAALLPDEIRAGAFPYKSVPQRAWIVAAGPLANFAFAAVVLAVLLASDGHPFPRSVVGNVVDGFPAAASGLQEGDLVTAVDGTPVERFMEIPDLVQAAMGARYQPREGQQILNYEDYRNLVHSVGLPPITLTIERDGESQDLTIVPMGRTVVDSTGTEFPVFRLGFIADTGPYGVLDSIWLGVSETVWLTAATFDSVGEIISGDRGSEELGGPIRIAQMSGDVAQLGIVALLWFMALLSVNLGLINLLPIPILDGGHLLFLGAEAALGRPLSDRLQEYGFRIGLALVLTLMVFATWNDLVNLQVFEFLSGLIS